MNKEYKDMASGPMIARPNVMPEPPNLTRPAAWGIKIDVSVDELYEHFKNNRSDEDE